ncbi:MAG TPA: CRISPR-associated endonuclease Cas2 [Clostridiales bacterium]|nr:CRISPR-associated endonuclease Cas2 [Clostridiales bacterium]
MLVLITYDVNTESDGGKRRLRQVAKICVNYGQRVQNSVFECSINPAQLVTIKNELLNVIDCEKDSLRFYLLGKNWERRVETLGKDNSYNPDKGVFIL